MAIETTSINCPECHEVFVGYLSDKIIIGKEYFSKCNSCGADVFFMTDKISSVDEIPTNSIEIRYVTNLST